MLLAMYLGQVRGGDGRLCRHLLQEVMRIPQKWKRFYR